MLKKTLFLVFLLSSGIFILWIRGELPEMKSLLESRTAGTPKIRPFNRSEFDEVRKSGNKIVLIVTATWNAASNAQRPLLRTIINTTKYNDFLFYDLDYNLNQQDRDDLFITQPATLIVYTQGQEVSRVTGSLNSEEIEKALGELKVQFASEDIEKEELEFAIRQAR